MKVCLIGGIYGAGGAASEYLRVTPETTLEKGLREAGHAVTTLSHYAEADFGAFDVVHVHHLSYGALRVAVDDSRTPLVFTVHDASQLNGARLGAAREMALRIVLGRADRVVSLSEREAAFRRQEYGLDAVRSVVAANGIDAARFPLRRSNAAGKQAPWRLLFVGQLIPLKGCDLILRAVASLGEGVALTLVYQTPELAGELMALAEKLGIRARVHFAGRQEPGELARLYQESDLLVMASETEALPSVITEAMLSGLPFVSTDVGGVREQAAGFGHLIARRTVEDLTAAIGHVLAQYERFAGQALRMSTHARATYSAPAMVARHLEIYRELAGQRARRCRMRHVAVNAVVRQMMRQFAPPGPGRTLAGPRAVTERT